MMKSRQNNERTAPKKGRTSAKSRTRSGKDLLADLNISASTGKVTQRPKPKTALPRVKTSAQEPKERKAAEPKVIFKKVDESNDGQRLDNFLLSQLKGVPKSLIYRVVRSGEVRVNKGRAHVDTRLQSGDEVRIPPIRYTEKESEHSAPPLKLSEMPPILFEDQNIMVVDKLAGMASHGGMHEARKQAGRFLAQEHPVEADVVIGVPDSGLDAALGYSQESGIPYGIGFIKNKYIGRTFIQGSQKQRENSVRIKLNVVSSTVKGKRVVLVDDSIVRGTTSARIIKLLRDAGAKEVHFRVSAPPFKYPCYFGTDIPDQKLLVATGRNVEQINEIIGADTLGYLSAEHVVQLAKNAKCGFCTACFTGEYAVRPEEVLSTDIHERHLNDRPKNEKKLGE